MFFRYTETERDTERQRDREIERELFEECAKTNPMNGNAGSRCLNMVNGQQILLIGSCL